MRHTTHRAAGTRRNSAWKGGAFVGVADEHVDYSHLSASALIDETPLVDPADAAALAAVPISRSPALGDLPWIVAKPKPKRAGNAQRFARKPSPLARADGASGTDDDAEMEWVLEMGLADCDEVVFEDDDWEDIGAELAPSAKGKARAGKGLERASAAQSSYAAILKAG